MPLPGADAQVNRILLDLTQRETRNRSSVFAETLLERIADKAPLLRRSHRDAGFMVLLAPDVPAVLLEMGFITNPSDERRLADGGERRRLMDGVAQAIETYFAGETMKVASRGGAPHLFLVRGRSRPGRGRSQRNPTDWTRREARATLRLVYDIANVYS